VTLGMSANFLVMAGLAALGIPAALLLWPAKEFKNLERTHPDLVPDHPKLRGHETAANRHPVVIDDLHRVWPAQFSS